MFTETASLDLVFDRFWSIRIVQVLVGDIIDKPTMNHGEWMMVGGCTGHEPQDCWREQSSGFSLSSLADSQINRFFLGVMVGRPHSYTMGAPYHYTQRHQSHWAWKSSTCLALDPTENGQVAILPTGDMEAQVTPEMHEMMHMWGQWWWNITRNWVWPILDDQIYQGFVFLHQTRGLLTNQNGWKPMPFLIYFCP